MIGIIYQSSLFFTSGIAISTGGKTLCTLYSLMKGFDRKVFFVYGGTDAKTRNDIRGIVKKIQSLSQVMARLHWY